ncbi:MAG TPA: hypothetical protein VNJ08_08255 [Bacteriovoracaceae bacterium]|nr:hypothetical protein [Bacteriovoracaceae bacterium]
MLWNSLIKNPILAIGILMFGLFIMQVVRKEKWGIFHNDKLISTSCRGALVRIEKKIPENWKVFCEGNNLAVEIRELAIPEKSTNLNVLMYRQLANHMAFVARVSTPDILEKVFFVRFKLMHPSLEINAVTEGKFIVKLLNLESPEHIMTHLKSTVQVQETVK